MNKREYWKCIILLVMMVLNYTALKAQQHNLFLVKGVILDSTSKKSIEFATISLLDKDKKVVALTYSDENGLFKSADISEGVYYLNLTFVGLRTKKPGFYPESAKSGV